MDAHFPILLVMVPLATAVATPLVARGRAGVAWALCLAATAFAAFAALGLLVRTGAGEVVRYALGSWKAPTGIEYVVDRTNAMVLVMVSAVAFLATLWMRRSGDAAASGRPAVFYAVFLLLVAGLLGIAVTGDLFNLYVFLEISSLASYALVALGPRRQALRAGLAYLVVGSIGATLILIGIGHLYMATGSLTMADIAARIAPLGGSSVVRTALAFLVAGLAMKMALFPLHGWQPAAYAEAPSGGAILLAAAGTKVAAYALYRVAFTVFGVHYLVDVLPGLHEVLLALAVAAIVLGPLLAVRQTDLRRMLAYSSVGQMGYLVLGVALLSPAAVTGSLVHFWNHAAAKGALFCVAGSLAFGTGARRVSDLAGLGRTAPWTGAVATVAGCSMVGIPLTAGFVSKYQLAVGALDAAAWFVVPVLLTSAALTAVYVGRALQAIWFAPKETVPVVRAEVPWSMRAPALVLAAACLVFGTTPWALDFARDAAASLLGGGR